METEVRKKETIRCLSWLRDGQCYVVRSVCGLVFTMKGSDGGSFILSALLDCLQYKLYASLLTLQSIQSLINHYS